MKNIPKFWEENVTTIQEKIGHNFNNLDLLVEAFTHCSYSNENNLSFNSERLEFLGDAILDLIATEYLFLKFTELEEGDLTYIRSTIVDAKACYKYTCELDIEDYIILGKGERVNGKPGRNTILADLFEALIGAIYIDAGMEKAKLFVLGKIVDATQKSIVEPSHNWKANLQEFCQKKLKTSPSYKVISESGPDHKKEYECGVIINGELIGKGVGQSKKEAQQNAAKEAIELMKKDNFKNDQD